MHAGVGTQRDSGIRKLAPRDGVADNAPDQPLLFGDRTHFVLCGDGTAQQECSEQGQRKEYGSRMAHRLPPQ